MTHVVACLDGLDPAYLAAVQTPGWDRIADRGGAGVCQGLVPSLTNVNNVGIVTGRFPEDTGVTGNTYYDPERDEQAYMTDPSHLRCRTELQRRAEGGETVVALVAKDKLVGMVGRGCDVAASAENPPDWLVDAVGDAPGIYSGGASAWLLDAARHVLDERAPDVLYVSTTDVIPHKHGPDEDAAAAWVRDIDTGVAALAERSDALVATADHGMNHKSVCVDLDAALAEAGHDAEVVRLITDEHTYHHRNLGGAAYVYLHDGTATTDAETESETAARLTALEGVDEVVPAEEAARRFRLPTDAIGDLLVLGTESSVFGPVDADGSAPGDGGDPGGDHDDGDSDSDSDRGRAVVGSADLRSHGSHHERHVPYVTTTGAELEYNVEAFAGLDA